MLPFESRDIGTSFELEVNFAGVSHLKVSEQAFEVVGYLEDQVEVVDHNHLTLLPLLPLFITQLRHLSAEIESDVL